VIDSDGAAILFYESLRGGTKLTRDSCVREKKPLIVLDARLITESAAAALAPPLTFHFHGIVRSNT